MLTYSTRSTKRVRLSPFFLAAALLPALAQTNGTWSCNTGDATLAELAVVANEENWLPYEADRRSYEVGLPPGQATALVRAVPTDPDARVWVDVFFQTGRVTLTAGVPGGGETTVPLEAGESRVLIYVQSPRGYGERYELALLQERRGEWSTPTRISDSELEPASGAAIAVARSGHAVAVWTGTNGEQSQVRANEYTVGLGWGDDTLVEETDRGKADGPVLALDAEGSVVAAWSLFQYPGAEVWASRYRRAEGWASAERVSENGAGIPAVVAGPGPAMTIGFHCLASDVLATVCESQQSGGTGWSAARPIQPDVSVYAQGITLALGGENNGHALWYQYGQRQYDIWTSRRTNENAWTTPEPISTSTDDEYLPLAVATSPTTAVAVWAGDELGGFLGPRLWSAHYDTETGTWSEPETLLSGDAHGVGSFDLATDAMGNATVVWGQSDNVPYSVRSRRYSAAAGWSAEAYLGAIKRTHLRVSVSVNARGVAMAAWLGPDGCLSNRYDPDYGWLGTQAVDGFPWSNWVGGIEIGVDGEGNALGVWVDAREAVWASRFE